MLTLAVRPSKKLILLYSLLYSLSLVLISVYGKNWPWFIFCIVIASLSCAGIRSLYSLCALKALSTLPNGQIELRFRRDIQYYDALTIRHQGPQLIIVHCKNAYEQRYLVCLADGFVGDDFALLQRWLKSQAWLRVGTQPR